MTLSKNLQRLNTIEIDLNIIPKYSSTAAGKSQCVFYLSHAKSQNTGILQSHVIPLKDWKKGIFNYSSILLLIRDKTEVAVLALIGLSKNSPAKCIAAKDEEDGVQCFKLRPWSAIISETINNILNSSRSDLSVRFLRHMFQGLRLQSINTMFSPPSINCSTKGSAPSEGRKGAAAEPFNVIYVVLGWSGDKPAQSVEMFDSNAQKWSIIQQETPFMRAYHGVALLGDVLYVVGGFNGRTCLATTICLSMRFLQWTRKSSMSTPRCYVSTVVNKGRIYAIGGHNGVNRLKTCEMLEPKTNKWIRISDMMYRRSDAAGAEVNGKILVCGGFDGFQFHSSAEVYDPDTDEWALVSSLMSPRSGHSMVSVDGHAFALGGFDGFRRMQEVEMFDEEGNRWQTFSPMLNGRSNFCAAIFQDEIYVMGGYDGSTTVSKVEKFNKTKMEWQRIPCLNHHRSAAGACVLSNFGSPSRCAPKGPSPVIFTNIEEPSP